MTYCKFKVGSLGFYGLNYITEIQNINIVNQK